MKFIIDGKIYDTEKAETIIKYETSYPIKILTGHTIYVRRPTTLYKTKKGNWFSVNIGDFEQHNFNKENEISVKRLFTELNKIKLYTKYFEELDEA
ncbi:hypothetical protein [Clostridium estertheticum]|uniref:Uncharacterized protein n=1 Tax=Clostridium estertheticum subsp. estertheticum TaxID=1552 RepID=A0A1J0GJT5_9CLOT|nr:hypothetical protein [Clostridium estertheticum]APC41543.1 hypothetical protein A7L45_16390 [Clostridium estertheticum subsp. estertheticum]MBW9154249.1 hypothetical protein [Clostridium estertheticum]WLC86678.1 hypothetical protein KTC97_21890 [Clostridium estertheticum]